MRNLVNTILLVLLVVMPFSAHAESELHNPYKSVDDIPYVLRKGMNDLPPIKKEDYITKRLHIISREGRNPDALDLTDYKLKVESFITGKHSKKFKSLTIYDLNKDQSVTQDEVMEAVKSQPCGFWSKKTCSEKEIWDKQKGAMKELFALDKNNDGKVSRNEILSPSPIDVVMARNHYENIRRTLAINPDGDEQLTTEELRTLAGFAFDVFDTDGDGTLSKTESEKGEKYSRELDLEEHRKVGERIACEIIKNIKDRRGCKLKRGLADDALIAFLGDKRILLTFGKAIDKKKYSQVVKPWSNKFTAKDLCWIHVEINPADDKEHLQMFGMGSFRFEDLPDPKLLLAAYNSQNIMGHSLLIGKDGLIKEKWDTQPDLIEVFDKLETLVQREAK